MERLIVRVFGRIRFEKHKVLIRFRSPRSVKLDRGFELLFPVIEEKVWQRSVSVF